MTWKNIRLILLREVRDQLRDRRTLFMVVVLPLLLYPGLAIGMLQMALYLTEHAQVTAIVGAKNLPSLPLISEGRFDKRWFFSPDGSEKLLVLTDSPDIKDSVDLELPGTSTLKKTELIDAAHQLQELALQHMKLAEQLAPFDPIAADDAFWMDFDAEPQPTPAQAPPNLQELLVTYRQIKDQLVEQFINSKLQVLVVIPENYGRSVEAIDRMLQAKEFENGKLHDYPMIRPVVIRNRANDKSEVAYKRVREALDLWEKQLIRSRMESANLPLTVADPMSLISIDVAGDQEVAANVWSKIFPALLVIMALTGAFYPAIDVAAGEKERGTMETLLICPATRSEIVLGKFITVFLFSVATTVLNLLSMGSTSRYIVSVTQAAKSQPGLANMPLPTPMAIFWMVLLLVPLAGLFSALSFALATFARSNKEGQYYLTPLFMVTLGMTMFAMSPSIELSTTAGQSLFYCMMPVVGPALLLKALLMNPNDTSSLVFAFPVLVSSCGYSMLALWWAVEQFKSEEVLFRDSERFDLRSWLTHLFREKELTPTCSEAVACFVIMLLLQFLSINAFGKSMIGVRPEDKGMRMLQLAVVQQIALIASPALFMAVLLTKSARRTLKLNWPKIQFLAAAVVLPLMLHPIANELLRNLHGFFPQLPDSARAAFATMADATLPLSMIIGTFALTPAICEEVAFRGFLLSGFSRWGRTGVAIVLSSVTFGIIHMIPQQVFNATLVGLVLGLLAVRSNSLLPGVVFHFCFNSLAVLHAQASEALVKNPVDIGLWDWFIRLDDNAVGYRPLTLALCGIASVFVLHWLVNTSNSGSQDETQELNDDANTPATEVDSTPPSPRALAQQTVAVE